MTNTFFKKSLVVFWACWWLIALWTDIVGGLAHLGVLHASFAPDLNYPALVQSMSMYHAPSWLTGALFIGILLWLSLVSVSFCWASLALTRPTDVWVSRARIAYIVSLGLWLAFFLSDQIVMKFDFEQNHMVQGGFEFLCFLSLYLLP
ncbi:MAG TPA: hypothetical protein VNC84_07675 [Gammaproteobacteria bacterium]|jgi:hypothetical protein|nr:hypothetical protein [Gammaproteobacteria bacterium]